MISVERILEVHHNKPSQTICPTDINSNMIGASIVSDNRASKQSSAGKLLDNETLLVILNTVLNTHSTKTTTTSRKATKHQVTSHTQSAQHNNTTSGSTTDSKGMVPSAK